MSHRVGATSHRHIAFVNVISRSCPPRGQTMSHRIVPSPPARVKGCYKPRCPDKGATSHRVHGSSRAVPAQFPHSSRTVPATVPARESLYNDKIRANDGAAPGGAGRGGNVQNAYLYLFEIHCLPPWGCTVIRANPIVIQGFSSGNCSGNCAGTVRELSGNCTGTVWDARLGRGNCLGCKAWAAKGAMSNKKALSSRQAPRCQDDDAMRHRIATSLA